jgi:hypothetical protein
MDRLVRTIVGVRHDQFWAKVTSDTPANSGNADASITSPKVGLVLGPFRNNEIFLNAGYGFHSNDVRGVTISVNHPIRRTRLTGRQVPSWCGPKAPRSAGARGRSNGLETSVALLCWTMRRSSCSSAMPAPPRRAVRAAAPASNGRPPTILFLVGFELDMRQRTRASRISIPPATAFRALPIWCRRSESPSVRHSAGSAPVKMRYFGPRPLIEDNSSRSPSTTLVNARLGYRFDNGIRVQLDAFNLFNAKADQITYFYESRLPGRDRRGVADQHFHPVERCRFA